MLEAVRQHGIALFFAAEPLKSDRELVLEAVRQHGGALEYAADPLRADRELVLEAVRQDGTALEFAVEPLKADRELVLEAVRQDGEALAYAAELLQADPLLTESSVAANPFAVRGAKCPVCTVFELSAVEDRIRYEAAWGVGGKTLDGHLPHNSTLGDLGRHIRAQAPNPNSRFCLTLLDSEIPVSPLQVEQPLAELM